MNLIDRIIEADERIVQNLRLIEKIYKYYPELKEADKPFLALKSRVTFNVLARIEKNPQRFWNDIPSFARRGRLNEMFFSRKLPNHLLKKADRNAFFGSGHYVPELDNHVEIEERDKFRCYPEFKSKEDKKIYLNVYAFLLRMDYWAVARVQDSKSDRRNSSFRVALARYFNTSIKQKKRKENLDRFLQMLNNQDHKYDCGDILVLKRSAKVFFLEEEVFERQGLRGYQIPSRVVNVVSVSNKLKLPISDRSKNSFCYAYIAQDFETFKNVLVLEHQISKKSEGFGKEE